MEEKEGNGVTIFMIILVIVFWLLSSYFGCGNGGLEPRWSPDM